MTLLAFDRVTKRHRRAGRELLALRDATFELHPGDFAAVLGERRSGRATLLRLAAGAEAPDVGTVSFGGRRLSTLRDADRAALWSRELACVWSRARWPVQNVLDAVTVPLLGGGATRREARRRAHAELRSWDVADVAGASLGELSDGERQRVALAAALVRRPRLLLAADPTETLDLVERNRLLARLQRVAREQGVAVLMTATDASGAVGVNRLLLLAGDGELRATRGRDPAPVVPLPTRRRAAARDA